jgi:hypothetical protein
MTYREEMDVYRDSMTPIPEEDHHDPPLGYDETLRPILDKAIDDYAEWACGDCGWTLEGEFVKCEEHKDGD